MFVFFGGQVLWTFSLLFFCSCLCVFFVCFVLVCLAFVLVGVFFNVFVLLLIWLLLFFVVCCAGVLFLLESFFCFF